MNGIEISGPVLFLAGALAVAVLSLVLRVKAGNRRARAAADIARVGTSVVSIVGRVVVTAAVIVGTQWVVITYAAANLTLLWVVLGLPALFAAYTLTKALTVTEVRSPTRHRRDGGYYR